jgi:type VI protein secretion system component VasK
MNGARLSALVLRLRLLLGQAPPVALAAGALILLGTGAVAWLLHATLLLEEEEAALKARLARPAATAQVAIAAPAQMPPPVVDNLEQFYATLGQRRYAEQQVKTLFGLARKSGLVLSQGEYKSAWDRNARVHTYQLNLPVKGSYAAIWQFALSALRAIPFASLDDISFRRDSIGDATVEARLRLTLYLSDQVAGQGGDR